MTQKNTESFRLLAATGNQGKMRELRGMLAGTQVKVCALDSFPSVVEVDETGSSFRVNAELKAAGYARQTGMWSLADDSGLEVAALGGAPGVHSARFAGASSNYQTKIASLLDQLETAGRSERLARFVCVMAVANPEGEIRFTAEGICEGKIANAPRGTGGFGYDPIFIPEGFEQTFAELPVDIKQQISHRGRAAREIIRYLLDFIVV